MTVTDLPVLLKPAEAAELLRTTVKSLGQDRFHGRGAPYIRIGSRILYDRDVLLDYIRAGSVTPARPLASRLRD